METNGITAGAVTQGFGGAAAAEPEPVSSEPTIASDFETFLRMLTVQLENQDPLNPQKAEDFAVQLATFSDVEQAVLTNQLLEDMMAQMNLSSVGNLADWIGKEALADTPAKFDGQTPVNVYVSPNASAEEVALLVQDERGQVVDRIPFDLDAKQVAWDGSTASGLPAEPGIYSFAVENRSEDSIPTLSKAEVYTRVIEARVEDGVSKLAFEGGGLVPANDVTALREPVGSEAALP